MKLRVAAGYILTRAWWSGARCQYAGKSWKHAVQSQVQKLVTCHVVVWGELCHGITYPIRSCKNGTGGLRAAQAPSLDYGSKAVPLCWRGKANLVEVKRNGNSNITYRNRRCVASA